MLAYSRPGVECPGGRLRGKLLVPACAHEARVALGHRQVDGDELARRPRRSLGEQGRRSGVAPKRALPQLSRERCHGGLITDGDADRIGAVAEDGSFVDSHKIYSILLRWLLERKKWPGEVVRAFNTTKMIDRIAAEHGRKLHECGIGFKNICDLMLEREILIGGEEPGGIGITRHLPERDGILNALLLANVMAEEKRTLAELVQDLQKKYGEHYYARLDMHIPNELKESAIARAKSGVREIGGNKVLRVETLDGVKFFLDAPKGKPGTAVPPAEAWLLLRASGTEPLLRVYSEAGSPETVQQLLKSAEAFVYQDEMAGTAAS